MGTSARVRLKFAFDFHNLILLYFLVPAFFSQFKKAVITCKRDAELRSPTNTP